jgi:hypothetical protein
MIYRQNPIIIIRNPILNGSDWIKSFCYGKKNLVGKIGFIVKINEKSEAILDIDGEIMIIKKENIMFLKEYYSTMFNLRIVF